MVHSSAREFLINKEKYHHVKEANEEYLGYFEDNIKALEEVIEPDITSEDIHITLGAYRYYRRFYFVLNWN